MARAYVGLKQYGPAKEAAEQAVHLNEGCVCVCARVLCGFFPRALVVRHAVLARCLVLPEPVHLTTVEGLDLI